MVPRWRCVTIYFRGSAVRGVHEWVACLTQHLLTYTYVGLKDLRDHISDKQFIEFTQPS